MDKDPAPPQPPSIRNLSRNIWAVSLTSFFMDISSEMTINLLPLFLFNSLGVKTNLIGLVEGVAESTSSLLKLFSGWFSDKIGGRKWLAVAGYGLSAFSKPFFYFANTWELVAGVRWADRIGKGIRTAPRDALIADSVSEDQRGFAFGFQRAADTAGAALGLTIALAIVWWMQTNQTRLNANTFRTVVLFSLLPAALALISLIALAKDVTRSSTYQTPKLALRSLGKPFTTFMVIVSLFDLGNSSDAFLILRAQERGISVIGILAMLVSFNLIYTLISTPAGRLSDHVGRRSLLIAGWSFYALVYLGFGLAKTGAHIFILYILYGIYYGLAYGASKAFIADLVPEAVRGTAYGTYNAVLGILDLPASLIAGFLWQGIGGWSGLGPSAPFLFAAGLAVLAVALMIFWMPNVGAKPTGG